MPRLVCLGSTATLLACASCALVAGLGDRTLGDIDTGAADAGDGGRGADGPFGFPFDASRPDAAGRDSAGPDLRIDPLDFGHTWVFAVTASDGGPPSCAPGQHISGVVGPGVAVNGAATLRYQSLCSTFLVDAIVDGDRVTVYSFDGHFQGGLVIVDAPVEDGHSWTSGGATYTWRDAGAVTVPAGSFDDCWARTSGSAGELVYCRGVGLTKVADVGYDAVLTSKSF